MSIQRKKIVIAEDEAILLKAMTIELGNAEFDVLCATNGEAAVDLVLKEKPDLLILDILMPKLNGLDALEKIRASRGFKHLPVIVLSNLSQEDDFRRAQQLGVLKYFIKATVDLGELVSLIRKTLNIAIKN